MPVQSRITKTPLETALKGKRELPVIRASESKYPRRFSISAIGQAKKGKTEFCCTCPKPYFWQFDQNRDNVKSWDHQYTDFAGMEPDEAIDMLFNVALPALYNREYDCETIVIDGWNDLASKLQATIPIPKTNSGGEDIWPHFRALKAEQLSLAPKILSVTEPFPGDPDRPTYNLVLTYHMIPETSDIMDNRGNKVGTKLERWVPDIEGGFKEKLLRLTGCVFWVDKEKLKDGTYRHFMHTKDPDRFRQCDDSVGGKGGYKRLEPQIENTWHALMSGWGVDNERA